MDSQRLTADYNVQHHAVTPLWSDKSKPWLAQWFSDNGFARGYNSNPALWNGLINPYTGGRSYAQAHAVGQRVDGSTPDATDIERANGYRVFWIVDQPWNVITYGAGNWEINRRAINIENLGNYLDYPLREDDCRVLGEFWRPRDQELGGATYVVGHKSVTTIATACPARIMENLDQIVYYVNNAPTPPQPQTPVWSPMNPARKMRAKVDTQLVNVISGVVIASYSAGTQFDFATETDWNGKKWYRTIYSTSQNVDNGIDASTLEDIPFVTVKDVTVTTIIPFESIVVEDPTKPEGYSEITQYGIDGIHTIVYTVTYTNGVETSRVVKSNDITQSIDQVTTIGTKSDARPPLPETGQDALSWLKSTWEWIKNMLSKFTFKG